MKKQINKHTTYDCPNHGTYVVFDQQSEAAMKVHEQCPECGQAGTRLEDEDKFKYCEGI